MSKETGRAFGIGLLTFGLGYLVGIGTALGGALRTIGISQMLGAASSALTKLPTRRNALNARGTVIGPQNALPIPFGRCRLPAAMAWYDSAGTGAKDLHYALAFGATHAGGCGGIRYLYIDGHPINIDTDVDMDGEVTVEPFAGFVNVRVYNGAESQDVDEILNDAFVAWGDDAYGRFLVTAAIRFRYVGRDDKAFQRAFPGGRHPQVEAVVDGVYLYDPRLDDTAGGSGPNRTNDPTSWSTSYPAPSALCAGTYLLMRRLDGGWQLPPTLVDWDSVEVAAADCEDPLTVPAAGSPPSEEIPRYTCNLPVDTNLTKKQGLDLICSTMLGHNYPVGSKIKIRAGVYEAPSLTIDETWLAGPVEREPKVSINSTFNAVRVLYRNADDNWKPDVSLPFIDAGYEADDGDRQLLKEIQADGVDNEYRAQAIAIITGRLSRYQGQIRVSCNAKALDLECFEVVNLSVRISATRVLSGVYRVINWTDWDGITGNLILQREDSAIWDLALEDFTAKTSTGLSAATEPTPPVPQLRDDPPFVPSGVVAGFRFYWEALQFREPLTIEIHRGDQQGGPYEYIDECSAQAGCYIDAFEGSTPHYYKIRSRDSRGNVSALSSECGGYRMAVDGNLAQPQQWASGTTGDQGDYVAVSAAIYNSVETEEGPDGIVQPVWIGETLGASGLDSGFVRTAGLTETEGFSHLDSYLMGVAFRRDGGPSGQIFCGPQEFGSPASVEEVGGGEETNPYFVGPNLSELEDGKWYLLVGVVYGSGYTGADQGYAGVYDPSTGEKIVDGVEYRWLTSATAAKLRSFMYGSVTTATEGRWAGPYIRKIVGDVLSLGAQMERDALTGLLRGTSDVRLGDARNGLQVNMSNTGATLRRQSGSGSPLTAADVGSDCTISVAATYLYVGDAGPVSIGAGTIPGLDFDTPYFVYAADPSLAGGSLTFLASVDDFAPSEADGYLYFGKVTTPADGGGSSGGEGGGGSECVSAEAWVPGLGYARDLRPDPGALTLTMLDDGTVEAAPLLQADAPVEAEIWSIETAGGARLLCSASTPVPIHDLSWRHPADLLGHLVFTLHEGVELRKELVTSVRLVGRGPVVPLHFGGRSFAAGIGPGRAAVVTHNPEKP